jgi:outer membrane protein assembly factor BamB
VAVLILPLVGVAVAAAQALHPFPVPKPDRLPRPVASIDVFPLHEVWLAELGQPLAAPPATDGRRLYAPLASGEFAAVSLADGRVEWIQTIVSTAGPAAGADSAFVAGDEFVAALDGGAGQVQWIAPIGRRLAAPLVWISGWLFAAAEGGDLYALRAETGERLWQRALGSDAAAAPTVSGDRMYVPLVDGRVAALDLTTGTVLWERKLPDRPTPILAHDDRLFVGSNDNFFYQLDARNGEVRWRWRTGGDLVGLAAADEERVYFVSRDNLLRALDVNHGAQRWMSDLQSRAIAGPLLVDDVVIVALLAPRIRGQVGKSGGPWDEITLSVDHQGAAPLLVEGWSRDRLLMVAIGGEGQVIGLAQWVEPPLVALDKVPGSVLAAEPAPIP